MAVFGRSGIETKGSYQPETADASAAPRLRGGRAMEIDGPPGIFKEAVFVNASTWL
jgi:hypothetical protein